MDANMKNLQNDSYQERLKVFNEIYRLLDSKQTVKNTLLSMIRKKHLPSFDSRIRNLNPGSYIDRLDIFKNKKLNFPFHNPETFYQNKNGHYFYLHKKGMLQLGNSERTSNNSIERKPDNCSDNNLSNDYKESNNASMINSKNVGFENIKICLKGSENSQESTIKNPSRAFVLRKFTQRSNESKKMFPNIFKRGSRPQISTKISTKHLLNIPENLNSNFTFNQNPQNKLNQYRANLGITSSFSPKLIFKNIKWVNSMTKKIPMNSVISDHLNINPFFQFQRNSDFEYDYNNKNSITKEASFTIDSLINACNKLVKSPIKNDIY